MATKQQETIRFISDNYLQFNRIRRDVVSDKLQIRLSNDQGKDYWREMSKQDINSIVCQCAQECQTNITLREVMTVLHSDLVPQVHPLREYVLSCRPWQGEVDWIDFIAQQVCVRNSAIERHEVPVVDRAAQVPVVDRAADLHRQPTASNASELQCSASETNYSKALHSSQSERSETDRLWRLCFKKWFVAMVASWMRDEVVNHQVLVLIGKQGIYKTTWLEHLIPPHLRAYCCKLANANQLTKDDRLRIAEFGLINLDELDAMTPRELNQMKSIITATDVNERAAYAYTKERRVRLASFCASSNRREFLTDITGNRRWLPFEVESIQDPFCTSLPYEQLYAQAWALVQDKTFNYWFDLDDIEVLEEHNQHFRDESNEEQLLQVYFAVPAKDAPHAKFLTTAEISEKLVSYGHIRNPMSLSQLGMLLSRQGFVASRQGNPARRGWIVYERNSEEVNAERSMLAKPSIASVASVF